MNLPSEKARGIMDKAKAFEQTKKDALPMTDSYTWIPKPPNIEKIESQEQIETCPACNAKECEKQPQAGTHCYSTVYECGARITFAIGHHDDYFTWDEKCFESSMKKIIDRLPLPMDNPMNDECDLYSNVHNIPENVQNVIEISNDKKDIIFMNIANEISQMSKCVSKQVGSVIVKEGRIISIGYNGTPKGWKNCNEVFDPKDFDRTTHHEFSENYEIHSELNALLFASRNSLAVDGATLYCTLEPCMNCIKNMCQSGIKRIVFRDFYDLKNGYSNETFDMLRSVGISIERIEKIKPMPSEYHPLGCT